MLVLYPLQLEEGPEYRVDRPETGSLVALYHPRQHAWREHFSSEPDGTIKGLTSEGRATVELLDMNDHDRVQLRALLLRRRSHP